MYDDLDGRECDAGLWTFPEAICWIEWRSEVANNQYREARYEDERDDIFYYLNWSLMHQDSNPDIRPLVEKPILELWKALIDGQLQATAIISEGNTGRSILSNLTFADHFLSPWTTSDDCLSTRPSRNKYFVTKSFIKPRLSEKDVKRLWPSINMADSSAAPSIEKSALYPWPECYRDLSKKFDDDGLPNSTSGDAAWRCQADAERWVSDWMIRKLGQGAKQPTENTVRRRVRDVIARFTKQRSEDAEPADKRSGPNGPNDPNDPTKVNT